MNTLTRYIDHTREVKKTNLVQENHLVVHVRPMINRYAQGSVRYINERREVRGTNCNCGSSGSRDYRESGSDDDGQQVSYRY